MTLRRRPAAGGEIVNGLRVFRWSLGPVPGTESLLDEPTYGSEAEARRGWQQWRRQVWAVTHRFRLPSGAEYFDHLTLTGLRDVYARWNAEGPFDLAPTARLLAEDEAAIRRFEQTDGARAIADFLALLRIDLAAVAQCAQALAALPAGTWPRPNPYVTLATVLTYGGGPEPIEGAD